jgi:general secretion pathway protein G
MQPKQTRVGERRPRGMTLIEIMVVITILGLIMAAVGVNVLKHLDSAKRDRARLDIANIQSALKLYYAKTGRFPDTNTGLRALVETRVLEEMPKDPWGGEYAYTREGSEPVILSYGADLAQGGEDQDADLSSRDLKRKDEPGR